MEAAIAGAAVVFVIQFGLLWYRIGRVEQKTDDICRRVDRLDNHKTPGRD